MNNSEDMSAEFMYLQAQVARLATKKDMKKHLSFLGSYLFRRILDFIFIN
jgi:hypothetical protein